MRAKHRQSSLRCCKSGWHKPLWRGGIALLVWFCIAQKLITMLNLALVGDEDGCMPGCTHDKLASFWHPSVATCLWAIYVTKIRWLTPARSNKVLFSESLNNTRFLSLLCLKDLVPTNNRWRLRTGSLLCKYNAMKQTIPIQTTLMFDFRLLQVYTLYRAYHLRAKIRSTPSSLVFWYGHYLQCNQFAKRMFTMPRMLI